MKIRHKESFIFVIFTLAHVFRLNVAVRCTVKGGRSKIAQTVLVTDLCWWMMDVAGEDLQTSNELLIFSLTRTDWLVFFVYR